MSTIPEWVRVGAEVVCVDDSPPAANKLRYHREWLVKGNVYTVRGFIFDHEANRVGLLLREIVSAYRPEKGGEQTFAAHRFRPITKRTAEQDIAEHFARHLTAPEGVNA